MSVTTRITTHNIDNQVDNSISVNSWASAKTHIYNTNNTPQLTEEEERRKAVKIKILEWLSARDNERALGENVEDVVGLFRLLAEMPDAVLSLNAKELAKVNLVPDTTHSLSSLDTTMTDNRGRIGNWVDYSTTYHSRYRVSPLTEEERQKAVKKNIVEWLSGRDDEGGRLSRLLAKMPDAVLSLNTEEPATANLSNLGSTILPPTAPPTSTHLGATGAGNSKRETQENSDATLEAMESYSPAQMSNKLENHQMGQNNEDAPKEPNRELVSSTGDLSMDNGPGELIHHANWQATSQTHSFDEQLVLLNIMSDPHHFASPNKHHEGSTTFSASSQTADERTAILDGVIVNAIKGLQDDAQEKSDLIEQLRKEVMDKAGLMEQLWKENSELKKSAEEQTQKIQSLTDQFQLINEENGRLRRRFRYRMMFGMGRSK